MLCARKLTQKLIEHLNGIAERASAAVGQLRILVGRLFAGSLVGLALPYRPKGRLGFFPALEPSIAVAEHQARLEHPIRAALGRKLVKRFDCAFVVLGLVGTDPHLVGDLWRHFSALRNVKVKVGLRVGVALLAEHALANQQRDFRRALGRSLLHEGFAELQQFVVFALARINLGEVVRDHWAKFLVLLKGLEVFEGRLVSLFEVGDVAVVVLRRFCHRGLGFFGFGQFGLCQVKFVQ